jgi:hypothetical protein
VVKISVQLSVTPCITQEVNKWSRSCDVILKIFSSLIMLEEQKNERLIRIFNEYDSYKNAIERVSPTTENSIYFCIFNN